MHIPSYPPVWWILGMSALIWLCSSKVSIHRCCLLCVCICVFVFSLDHHTFNSIHYTRIYCMNLSSNIKPSKLANQIIPLKNVKCSVCNVVLNCVNSFVVVCETDQTRATATVFSFVSLFVNIHLFLYIKLSIVYLNRHCYAFSAFWFPFRCMNALKFLLLLKLCFGATKIPFSPLFSLFVHFLFLCDSKNNDSNSFKWLGGEIYIKFSCKQILPSLHRSSVRCSFRSFDNGLFHWYSIKIKDSSFRLSFFEIDCKSHERTHVLTRTKVIDRKWPQIRTARQFDTGKCPKSGPSLSLSWYVHCAINLFDSFLQCYCCFYIFGIVIFEQHLKKKKRRRTSKRNGQPQTSDLSIRMAHVPFDTHNERIYSRKSRGRCVYMHYACANVYCCIVRFCDRTILYFATTYIFGWLSILFFGHSFTSRQWTGPTGRRLFGYGFIFDVVWCEAYFHSSLSSTFFLNSVCCFVPVID